MSDAHDNTSSDITESQRRIRIGGLDLATAQWGDGPPRIVMLHDGLGSIAQWRSVPAIVANETGVAVLAYERRGHGSSVPAPDGPWPADWLHQEAATLVELLDVLELDAPYVVGHSDGASIALIHAATNVTRLSGVLAIAAHSWVEDICVESIVAMRNDRERLVNGLARFHDAPAAVFEAWSGVWVSEAFRTWDIRPMIGAIEVPAVVAQGEFDAYATPSHPVITAQAIGANARAVELPGLGHIAHHDDAQVVADLIVSCWRRACDDTD